MKVLYAIQGTGNGHISRARDIIPELQKYVDVEVMVSGIQSDVQLSTPPKYLCKGMSFIFGKNGGVDLWGTFKKNDSARFLKEIKELPVQNYDLVINDFEPVSAWACKQKKVPCIGLSHQSAVIAAEAPRPNHTDYFGEFILKNYAPVEVSYGFHFEAYSDKISTPVIRKQVRELSSSNEGHYTVYLPAYDDAKLIEYLKQFPEVQWQVFSKHSTKMYREANVSIQPVQNEAFMASMASAEGVLCGAGFETPAETMFLEKKLLVIPMKGQYEQHCNAAALEKMGVPVIKALKNQYVSTIRKWLSEPQKIKIAYPNITEKVVTKVLEDFEKKRQSLQYY